MMIRISNERTYFLRVIIWDIYSILIPKSILVSSNFLVSLIIMQFNRYIYLF